jgi:hypothetical protein
LLNRFSTLRRGIAAAPDDNWMDFSTYLLGTIPEKLAVWMSTLTFEIVYHNEAPVIADVLTLPDKPAMSCWIEGWPCNERAVWSRVEALALRTENRDNTFIRVKNSEGATVVRTGIATALASIEMCSCLTCPIKMQFERRVDASCSS